MTSRMLTLFILCFIITTFAKNSEEISDPYRIVPVYNKQLDGIAIDIDKKGIPDSTFKQLDNLRNIALKKNLRAIYLQSVVLTLRALSQDKETALQKSYDLLSKELRRAPFPENTILHAFMAKRLYTLPSSDIKTKKGTVKYHQIDSLVMLYADSALAHRKELSQIEYSKFESVLLSYKEVIYNKEFRPTLMDLIGHDLIRTFASSRYNRGRYYTINNKKYHLPSPQFNNLKMPRDMKHYSFSIFQKLSAQHLQNGDIDQAIYGDISRLAYLDKRADISGKDSLALKSLRALAKRYRKSSIYSEIQYQRTVRHFGEEDWQINSRNEIKARYDKVLHLCDSAIAAFPNSHGAENAEILRHNLSLPTLHIDTKPYIHANETYGLMVQYKNVTGLKLSFIPLTDKELLEADSIIERRTRWSYRSSLTNEQKETYEKDERVFQELLNREPVLQKEISFKKREVSQFYTTQLGIPSLPRGKYLVVAESKNLFNFQAKQYHHSFLQVTDIHVVRQNVRPASDTVEFLVTDRKTGSPMDSVTVTYYANRELQKVHGTYLTDSLGIIRFPYKTPTRDYLFTFKKGDNYLYIPRRYWKQVDKFPEKQLHLYTDRSIYRPGDTIHIKGILTQTANNKTDAEVVPNTYTPITIRYPNKTSETLKLTTNGYGSVSGYFITPSKGLNGRCRLNGPFRGETYVYIEEYRKPTFEVLLDSVEKKPIATPTTIVSGKVRSFAKYPIKNANVQYSTTNYGRFTSEKTTKSTQTDSLGCFSFSIENKYDKRRVYLKITDPKGETVFDTIMINSRHKWRNISLQMAGTIFASDSTIPVSLVANTYHGLTLPASGTLTIHPLIAPQKIPTDFSHFQNAKSFYNSYDKKSFKKLFPQEEYSPSVQSFTLGDPLITRLISKETKNLTIKERELLKPGYYKAYVTIVDTIRYKIDYTDYRTYKDSLTFLFIDLQADTLPVATELFTFIDKPEAMPGDTVTLLYGSSLPASHYVFDIYNGDSLVKSCPLPAAKEMQATHIPIDSSYEGGITATVTMVYNGETHTKSNVINVPWDNNLELSLEEHTTEMKPGDTAQWRIKVSDRDNKPVSAELLLTMYDASLDKLKKHNWTFTPYKKKPQNKKWTNVAPVGYRTKFEPFFPANIKKAEDVRFKSFVRLFSTYVKPKKIDKWVPKAQEIKRQCLVMGPKQLEPKRKGMQFSSPQGSSPIHKPSLSLPNLGKSRLVIDEQDTNLIANEDELQLLQNPSVIRKDFRETALFLPHLGTDSSGNALFKFTLPDAITRWKLSGIGHTTDLKTGTINSELLARKKLMIVPNVPRYVYEQDTIIYAVDVTNFSKEDMKVKATLSIFNSLTMEPLADSLVPVCKSIKSKPVTKRATELIQWRLPIPSVSFPITYRVTATGNGHTDSEERVIPVLPNKIRITESKPLFIADKGRTKETFTSLKNSFSDTSIQQQSLKLELCSNPIWYVVQSLPFLKRNYYNSANDIFFHFYLQSLTSHIKKNYPEIDTVLKEWNKDSLVAYEKLRDKKEITGILQQQTPWLLGLEDEAAYRRELYSLFKSSGKENYTLLSSLRAKQDSAGLFRWYDHKEADTTLTLYILTGLAHLLELGVVKSSNETVNKIIYEALLPMDKKYIDWYNDLMKNKVDLRDDHYQVIDYHYLYVRSLFKDRYMNPHLQKSLQFLQEQAIAYADQQSYFTRALISIALWNFGKEDAAKSILDALHEESKYEKNEGRYLVDSLHTWDENPIETQALLIEAYNKIYNDTKLVDQLKQWLIRNKQHRSWGTRRGTAEACYALLQRGSTWSLSSPLPQVKVGTHTVTETLDVAEIGSNFFTYSWMGDKLRPNMATVRIKKRSKGPTWGALYWTYFQDVQAVKSSQSELEVTKSLFIKRDNDSLVPYTNQQLSIGDKVVVRLSITTHRDLQYIHLKDSRAACLEPQEQFSGVRDKKGVTYYETTKDASTEFFFDQLDKGTYHIEYPLIVSQRGVFSLGIAEIQSFYNPQYRGHTQGGYIRVSE